MDSFALRFLIHLVGDAHNPLHSSSFMSEVLYEGSLIDGDKEGHLIPVDPNYSKKEETIIDGKKYNMQT